ncbi:MAG: D-aminoacyl-tRNA deacylase [Opitutales bacterium]
MRAVVQRVSAAAVQVDGETVGAIERGLLVFLGVQSGDTDAEMSWLAAKVAGLRVFEDAAGRMNRSLAEVDGASALVISQFTLFGNTRKGYRPSFNRAAAPELAIPLYEGFARTLETQLGRPVAMGRFGEHMRVDAVNDGPVTLILDTAQKDF